MSTVYFATNRNPNRVTKPTSFGRKFAGADLGDLRFGQAEVSNGKLSALQVLPDNPEQGSEALFKELRTTMNSKSLDSLVFVHGFNVSFREAIESAAHMSEYYAKLSSDTYQPNIFVFSWPSDGQATNYGNDRHDAEASGYAFARGMLKLAKFLRGTDSGEACQQKIHLLAHSMGNYVIRHALQQALKISGGTTLPRLFDDIVLTAADEDSNAFEHDHKLAKLSELGQRITVYFNNADMALTVSEITKGNPERLGHHGPNKPFQVPAKVAIVDTTAVAQGLSDHLYHVVVDKVAMDIIEVLKGTSSDQLSSRVYVPHANKFRLE